MAFYLRLLISTPAISTQNRTALHVRRANVSKANRRVYHITELCRCTCRNDCATSSSFNLFSPRRSLSNLVRLFILHVFFFCFGLLWVNFCIMDGSWLGLDAWEILYRFFVYEYFAPSMVSHSFAVWIAMHIEMLLSFVCSFILATQICASAFPTNWHCEDLEDCQTIIQFWLTAHASLLIGGA